MINIVSNKNTMHACAVSDIHLIIHQTDKHDKIYLVMRHLLTKDSVVAVVVVVVSDSVWRIRVIISNIKETPRN